MLRNTLILTAIALTTVSVSAAQAQRMTPGQAQQLCAPRQAIVEKLKAEFDEEPESLGVTNSGGLFEILSSAAGTWTVLATGPNGVSCLVLSGDGWMTRSGEQRDNKAQTKASTGPKRDL